MTFEPRGQAASGHGTVLMLAQMHTEATGFQTNCPSAATDLYLCHVCFTPGAEGQVSCIRGMCSWANRVIAGIRVGVCLCGSPEPLRLQVTGF
jgi:hypothetical protein